MKEYQVLFHVSDLNAEYELEGEAYVYALNKREARRLVEDYIDTYREEYVWADGAAVEQDTILPDNVKEGVVDFDLEFDKRRDPDYIKDTQDE